MPNWLKNLFKKKGFCPSCKGRLVKVKADVVKTYGKPIMMCSKCKKLVEI